jgi:hypothetical protein
LDSGKTLPLNHVLLAQINVTNAVTLLNVLFARITTTYSMADADLTALVDTSKMEVNAYHAILRTALLALPTLKLALLATSLCSSTTTNAFLNALTENGLYSENALIAPMDAPNAATEPDATTAIKDYS